MADYIDRQAAIDAVGDVHPLDYNSQAIVERLKTLPSADVAPVLRRQHIIIKVNRFVPSSEIQRVKQDVMHQLESDGVAVVDCGVEVITVDADVLAVE